MIEIKSNIELSKYIKELADDVELKIDNIREKSMLCTSIRAKWLSYYYKEKENLERIKATKSRILQQKSSEIQNTDSVLRLKREEAIAKNDVNIQKLNKLSQLTQDNIDYIERAMDILSNFGFSIKNVADILKLEKMS